MNDYITAALLGLSVFFLARMLFSAKNRTSPQDARAAVDAGAILLDVRSPSEYASGAIKGAKNIPVQGLGSRLDELDKERTVVVYCRSGMRSSQAASLLRGKGFTVLDLGPMGAWPQAAAA